MSEPMVLMLIAFAGAVCVFLFFWVLISWQLSRRRAEQDRRIRPADDSDPTLVLGGVLGRESEGFWGRLYRDAAERMQRTELRLEVADAAAIVLFCGVVLAAIVFFWRYEDNETWLAFPAFAIGAGAPLLFFAARQRTWRRRMQDQLPDMIFLLARSLRSGMSIDQSMQVLGDHGVAPLSREFARMHRQLDLGLGLPQVLQSTADRVQLVDFSVFASVLSLHRSTGGNLPIIMDRLANTTREHNQMRGYYRATTSMGRWGVSIAAILITIILFYLFFFQRELAVHYTETPAGRTLFAIGLGLQVIGLFLLWRFTRDRE